MYNMITLFRSILAKNEHKAYTELANIDWKKTYEIKDCHVKESGLSRLMHGVQSIACGWFFLKLALFCFIWHPIFPNIGPHWATNKLKNWDKWYSDLNRKLKIFSKRPKRIFHIPNPFAQIGW